MNDQSVLLYVEDEEHIREEMLEILELDFDKVYTAKNGQEGLEIYKKCEPDLVISDIQMPVMDGLTLSKEILSIKPDAKIILTSAFNEHSYREQIKEMGITAYISKPVNIHELFEQVNLALT